MTIVLDRFQPCRLCGAVLRSCYLNLDEMIFMCSNPKCCFPLMDKDLAPFIVSQCSDTSGGALDELSQEPFFAELFGTMSSSTVSTSRPASRIVTPPYSAVPSVSSEGDEEFTNMSLINSALITTLCIRAIEEHIDQICQSVIGSIFAEISKALGPNGTVCNCANKLVEIISEKILFFRPTDNNLSVPIRLNQLMNRLLTDAQAVHSCFKVETSTSANCDVCGFSQTWNSQASSLQLRHFSGHENMQQFTSVESCSECGSSSKNVSTVLTKLSDVIVMCCHEKASQAMTSASDLSSPFVDFERTDGGETSRYALTTIVKYDEHVRRIFVAVRRDSESLLIDVNNWLRYDSLESFVSGRFTNPPNAEWLTSLPLLLVWQRVDKKPWRLSDSSRLSALQTLGSTSAVLATQPPIVNATSKFLNISSQQTARGSSRNSSISGVSTFVSARSTATTQKFVLTPPTSTTAPLKPVSSKLTKMLLPSTPLNSMFLQKSLERLSAHRRCLEGKSTPGSSKGSVRTASQVSSSTVTNVSPRSSIGGSDAKRARLDCSGSFDGSDV